MKRISSKGSNETKKIKGIKDWAKSKMHNEGMAAYVGNPMVIAPGQLIFDKLLADGCARYWCALRMMLSDNEIKAAPTPTEMAERLGINRKTATNHFKFLRAARWITVFEVIYINNLPTRFSYVIQDSRMSLEDVLSVDPSYVDFIFEESLSSDYRKLQHYCKTVVMGLDKQLVELLNHDQKTIRKNIQSEFTTKFLGFHAPVDQNSDSEKNPVDQNSDSEKNPVDRNPDSEKNPVDRNPDSEKNPVDQNSDSGDIYKTACAYAPTQIRISVGDKDNTTTSSESCSSRSDFNFFNTSELLKEILYDMEHDQMHFGKSSVHAVKNLLKRKNYQNKNGQSFSWFCTEKKATEMLVVLLVDKPDSPLNYLKTLIFADCHDDFILKPKQRKVLIDYHKRINPDYQQLNESTKRQRQETPIQIFSRWIHSNDDKREFKHQNIKEGQRIKALVDLAQFDAKSKAVAELTLPTWITDLSVRKELIANGFSIDESNIDRVKNLYVCFGNADKKMDYETVCKAIELGLLSMEEN